MFVTVPLKVPVRQVSVAPVSTDTGPAKDPVTASVPACTSVVPEYVLPADRVRVPEPCFVRPPPVPWIVPLNVVEFAVPAVSYLNQTHRSTTTREVTHRLVTGRAHVKRRTAGERKRS